MINRTDDEIGWNEARKHGITSDREYEAFQKTTAYHMAILRGRVWDVCAPPLEWLVSRIDRGLRKWPWLYQKLESRDW